MLLCRASNIRRRTYYKTHPRLIIESGRNSGKMVRLIIEEIRYLLCVLNSPLMVAQETESGALAHLPASSPGPRSEKGIMELKIAK